MVIIFDIAFPRFHLGLFIFNPFRVGKFIIIGILFFWSYLGWKAYPLYYQYSIEARRPNGWPSPMANGEWRMMLRQVSGE
ncbi:MAG: hypothetical protein B6247_13830 [Candidatus Parabeggiatoa sp. nov. 2]|nr:MAG: hypothetical protein B6247_13830 [Beggiatoa sp. 4572_84]